ncbi:MAG TPA: GTPase domain-containing protein [Tepidisphaeraceae bacterium]|nr:GTPase domain-containing protein [Tepidisphaeraceae bacterium]
MAAIQFMNSELQQLVEQTIELTGAARPTMLGADAPTLAQDDGPIYLVGLIGGKDVGKSSLVNAIVGQTITPATSFGPGTETVIAYAHESAVEKLEELLTAQLPGRFSIVSHKVLELRQQVLLDLPDIDSKYDDHVQITRGMLRHILYPLWIQSVEKYADLRPQELLAAVAQGNDPANFLFCLNKADQIQPDQAEALRQDFGRRLARVTGLKTDPRVHLLSAARPQEFDLPALRQMLCRQKPQTVVQQSRSLAIARQERSLLDWIGRQRLEQRAEQLSHLQRDAQEIAAARLAPLLLDQAIPRLLEDPGQRMSLFAPATRLRLSRWPIVNAIDALLSPVLLLIQKNLSATGRGSCDPDVYLDKPGAMASAVQSTFAQIQQLHPQAGALFDNRRLWEDLPAESAAADLRRRLASAIDRQRDAIVEQGSGRWHLIFAPLRWLLTIGAVLWFPLVQPLLAAGLTETGWAPPTRWVLTLVNLLGVAHLLACSTFLIIWFVGLWMVLRFGAYRRVNRIIEQWKQDGSDNERSLSGQSMQWIEQLLEPIDQQKKRIDQLIESVEKLNATSPVARPLAPARIAG